MNKYLCNKALFLVVSAIAMALMLSLSLIMETEAAEKQTIYNSPYVTFTPDGKAWTTHKNDSDIKIYPYKETVTTGITSSLRGLNEGEHYYNYQKIGEVAIEKWVVSSHGKCIHSRYPSEDYHALAFRKQICTADYFSGWLAYCADCHERISVLVYMSEEAAESIDYIEARAGKSMEASDMDYYYLCPFCTNLEQGAPFVHECKEISYNRYRVTYDRNHAWEAGQKGEMFESYHLYNNAISYDGEVVTPVVRLTPNTFKRRGFEFVGWNTQPDGSGVSFADGEEILNLSSADCKIENTWHMEADGQFDNGTVTLYAQWRRSESTLRMYLGDGTYQGQNGPISVIREFGTIYTIDKDAIENNSGYAVNFNANGGTATDYDSGERITKIKAERPFVGWRALSPMKGLLSRNVYYFIGPDGSVDEIEATYGKGSIILPNCKKEGYSFGGWYSDSALTKPVGRPGEEYTPTDSVTLYASWVELTLTATDNYHVNGGRGAVDLFWEQEDNKDKVYRIYQSTNASTWKQVGSATDVGNLSVKSQGYHYTGTSVDYIVPYAGVYNIYAWGAQGGRAGSYSGGKGGRVYGCLYLDAGEKLTLTVGGQNGYNGGGTATLYGAGGGATRVVSDKKGTLLVGGGGGGATTKVAGGDGGALTGLRADGESDGADGSAGGGGGYVGGTAGDYEVHNCVDDCSGLNTAAGSFYEAGSGVTVGENGVYGAGQYAATFIPSKNAFSASATGWNYTSQWAGIRYYVGSAREYLSTPKSGELNFHFDASLSGDFRYAELTVTVYDKDTGNVVYSFDAINAPCTKSSETEHLCNNTSCIMGQHKRTNSASTYTDPYATGQNKYSPYTTWSDHDGNFRGVPGKNTIRVDFAIPVPESVKGVYMVVTELINGKNHTQTIFTTHMASCISNVSYTYPDCGYMDGEVLFSIPAYGGSNYVAEAFMNQFGAYSGERINDGYISISADSVGYLDMQKLAGISAPDLAAPDAVAKSRVKKRPVGNSRAEISWEEPRDNGTPYYHKVESYLKGSTSKLCTSNIARNTLTTGIKGYYYMVDTQADTDVEDALIAGKSPSFTEQRNVTVDVTQETKYLHVAVVDKAENISETLHVKISAAPESDEAILWELSTGPLTVEDTDYTHPAATGKWYVKADGMTPFTMMYDGVLEGTASLCYQPNYSIFISRHENTRGESILYTESHEVIDERIVTRAEGLVYSIKDSPILGQYPYMITERSEKNTKLRTIQKFTLDDTYHGKEVSVSPRIGAIYGTEVVYSDERKDSQHTIIIMGDGEAPVITGLDSIDGTEVLEVSAKDVLSGVGKLYVEVINTDNNDRIIFYPETDGKVRIRLSSGDPMFDGDLQIRAVAVDNVGNENEIIVSASEFSMTTSIERLLIPHEPVFKCGESGLLTITTYGYADRIVVEFPWEPEAENGYSKEFIYPTPSYMAEEKMQFMVPLYTPEQQYTVKVTAYKNGREMQRNELNMVVSGTVLQELRTRLR